MKYLSLVAGTEIVRSIGLGWLKTVTGI